MMRLENPMHTSGYEDFSYLVFSILDWSVAITHFLSYFQKKAIVLIPVKSVHKTIQEGGSFESTGPCTIVRNIPSCMVHIALTERNQLAANPEFDG